MEQKRDPIRLKRISTSAKWLRFFRAGFSISEHGQGTLPKFLRCSKASNRWINVLSKKEVSLSGVVFPTPVFDDEKRKAGYRTQLTQHAQPSIGAFADLQDFERLRA